jgi:hypothetical protein
MVEEEEEEAEAGRASGSATMSLANPFVGAPRIHGELLKLGIDVGQITVSKYLARGWKTFLYNHADGIASTDLFVVPTISFRLLYGLLLLHHHRRQSCGWEGLRTQRLNGFPTSSPRRYGWKVAPRYIVRDRDAVYGDVFIRRLGR